MRNIHGAIFDMDGTLLDTMPIYDTAIADMLHGLGYEPRGDLYEAVRPLSGREVLSYIQREYSVKETLDELDEALDRELFDYYNKTSQLKSGVAEILEEFKRRGIPMCVCTATNRVHVEAALERTGIASYFKRIFTCSEENTGKREPVVFLKAAGFMKTEPRYTYVFEDAVHAVKSAKSAGFYVVAVSDKAEEINREEIIETADEFYDNLCAFVW